MDEVRVVLVHFLIALAMGLGFVTVPLFRSVLDFVSERRRQACQRQEANQLRYWAMLARYDRIPAPCHHSFED